MTDEGGRRTQEQRRAETERRVVEAATELIATSGSRRITLAQVGEAAGRHLADAAERPGLALLALEDHDAPSGTLAQHRAAGEAAGAEIAELAGAGHWWPVQDPRPAAAALTAFWARVGP